MKEGLSIVPVEQKDQAIDLSDERTRAYLAKRAHEITRQEVEEMDWNSGNPEKRERIYNRELN